MKPHSLVKIPICRVPLGISENRFARIGAGACAQTRAGAWFRGSIHPAMVMGDLVQRNRKSRLIALCQSTGRARANIQASGARLLWPKLWICRHGIAYRGLEFCIFRSLRE